MDIRYRTGKLLLAALIAFCPVAAARSQQVAASPDGSQPLPAPKSIGVLSVIDSNPTTPAELTRSVKILAALGRPDLGKEYLVRVLQAKLDQQQLADLGEQLGSATFIELAVRVELLPEGKQLADAVLAATNRRLRDPQHLAELIEKLKDPSAQVRAAATAALRQSGSAGVESLTGVLADPNRAEAHAATRSALVHMGPQSVASLLGLLEASDPAVVVQAIRGLAQTKARNTAIYLLRPYASKQSDPAVSKEAGRALKSLLGHLPSRSQARGLLSERAGGYFDGRRRIASDFAGQVEIWRYDNQHKTCVAKQYPVDLAGPAVAARLARDAYALDAGDPAVRCLHVATMLELAAQENGLEHPLPTGEGTVAAEAAEFGVGQIEAAMEYAMAGDHAAAAAAAAQILGQIGTADELLYRDSRPAPLVRAAGYPDRRVRMAALGAIVRLQPRGPYAGSSLVPRALAFFAAHSGSRRALVAGPIIEDSRRYAGLLGQRGFDVDTATTGSEALRLAAASPDYELALIDVAVGEPTAEKLVQQLRRDCRSADLRVAILARGDDLVRAQRVARLDPLTLAFVRPTDDQAFAWQLDQLSALAPRAFVTHDERRRQAAAAMGCLVELTAAPGDLYDLRRVQGIVLAALYVPQLGPDAVTVLGKLGTPESQRGLVDLASRFTQPLDLRKAALAAFRRSTEEYGILLTTDRIVEQYDRYNKSEDLDLNSQHILSMILNYIEAPTEPLRPAEEEEEGKAVGGRRWGVGSSLTPSPRAAPRGTCGAPRRMACYMFRTPDIGAPKRERFLPPQIAG